MANARRLEELIQKLEDQQKAYEETRRQVEELLGRDLQDTRRSVDGIPRSAPRCNGDSGQSTANTPDFAGSRPGSPRQSFSRGSLSYDKYLRKVSTSFSLQTVQSSSESKATGDESDEDQDESYFAQELLETVTHHHDELREHLKNYGWDDYCKKVLETIVDDESRLQQPNLFPTHAGKAEDRSHYSHYQVFDVGKDGAPVPVDVSHVPDVTNKATALWHAIKDVNQSSRERKAVGRITIAREPSPILFGAIHLTMHRTFDMDELFKLLVKAESTEAHMHRAFDSNPMRQSSFVFSFEYFTIIGDECEPMKWQWADRQKLKPSQHHIPLTRCSSVVALALNGKSIKKIRNTARRATTAHGWAYDPWASWQVLNIQCYPDWKSSTDTHDSTKHYVNGPEAFMYTLLGEYRDAQGRFEDICKRIARIVTPPLDFMWNSKKRDALLFEDKDFTYSRRYFWAFQTLGIMNDSIKAMIDAYENNFTDEVWQGQHKTLWPLLDENSPRNVHYVRQMSKVRKLFDIEISNMNDMIEENSRQRKTIQSLRDQLFSGTSVLESRRSVEGTYITVQQGHNIKILTLVSMVFLPLTFVTGVFGMTNMSERKVYWQFAVVTVCVCVPFLLLVGSLNTTSGMQFWRDKTKAFWHRAVKISAWLFGFGKKNGDENQDGDTSGRVSRTDSANANIRLRRFGSTLAPAGGKVGAHPAEKIEGLESVESPGGLGEIGRRSSMFPAIWRKDRTKSSQVGDSSAAV